MQCLRLKHVEWENHNRMKTVRLTKDSQRDLLDSLLKRSPNNYGQYESVVADIIANVREKGDKAVFD